MKCTLSGSMTSKFRLIKIVWDLRLWIIVFFARYKEKPEYKIDSFFSNNYPEVSCQVVNVIQRMALLRSLYNLRKANNRETSFLRQKLHAIDKFLFLRSQILLKMAGISIKKNLTSGINLIFYAIVPIRNSLIVRGCIKKWREKYNCNWFNFLRNRSQRIIFNNHADYALWQNHKSLCIRMAQDDFKETVK